MGEPAPSPESAEELYEGAPCGYFSIAPDGMLLRVNRTLLAWTGYERKALVGGRSLQDLLTVGGKVYFETHVRPLLQMQGAVQEIQLEFVCANGQTLPVLLNAVLRRDAAGLPHLVHSMVFNITDRKRYEHELLMTRRVAEQRARFASLSADVSRALAGRLETRSQLQACTDAIIEHLEALEARIWSVQSESGELKLEACAGVSRADPSFVLERAPTREARAAKDRRATFFQGREELVPEHGEDWLRRDGASSGAALPLISGDRVLGILAFYSREPIDGVCEQALLALADELVVSMKRADAERERDELLGRLRVQAEELRQSRELLEITLQSIGDGVIATDAQMRVTFVNPVAEDLTRWTSRDAAGRPLPDILKLINETSRSEVENPVEQALRVGNAVGLANHTLLVRRDGTEIAIDDSAAPIRGPGGEVRGAVLVFRDVSSQRTAERALRQTQQRLTTVLHNAPVVLFSLDREGTILMLEGKGLSALGVEQPEARVGQSAFKANSELPWPAEQLQRALTGESFVGGGALGERIFENHYTPIFGEHGGVAGTVGVAIEVTERKRYEEAIEKTLEFEKQLLGIVSHDLRNPVAAILLSASLLLRKGDVLDEQALRAATRIQNSADRAQRLIRDLLDFTQARLGGGIPIQRTDTDLSAVVRQVIDEVEASHSSRSISFETQGDSSGNWDSDRLAQVVMNLVSNALKYGLPPSPVQVALREMGDRLCLEIHNEGEPIAPQSMPQLFLPMRRATSKIDKMDRSVGLGLYIVKCIVDAHGGDIQVQSDAATGTTFRVLLPRG